MGVTFPALVCTVALAAISAQATPLAVPRATPALDAGPAIELVRDGCGYGYFRTGWQDQWGYWHWGRCVPKWWGRGAFLPPG
jgi:hypothetical protein